jgi:hypothetical protein
MTLICLAGFANEYLFEYLCFGCDAYFAEYHSYWFHSIIHLGLAALQNGIVVRQRTMHRNPITKYLPSRKSQANTKRIRAVVQK